MLRNFSLRFRGQGACVVENVDLDVAAGEILCIVGESGCGKSVTAMALMGLLPSDTARIPDGSMTFDGRTFDLTTEGIPSDMRGSDMAMIFQEPMTSLNPAFRIGDQIAESVERHKGCSRADARARALEMLRRVGLPSPEQRLDQYPHQLSGGQRQRVMIAMALANDPRLLIADEPTTALDVTIQAQILELIRDLQRDTGMGTIMITHDLGVVAEVADTVAVMYGGQIVETGPVAEVFENPQHPYTIGLMASVPRLTGPRARLTTIPGTVPTTDAMAEGCRFRTRCAFAAPLCATRPAPTRLTGGHAVACHFAPLEQHLAVAG
ncbi:ABC transporter ATP-binding protein [Jannaschia pohangensis]|uniref:Peptide/nickel transport system ATP-binding protein n=1 Tax=Jannaschia pohangensis TaxID=390807 RepID=A0A1I3T8B5_9RHOB|nr:ABC transporter ATP-binding protein [Jannaschia pohangensis]SFJ67408.1 peptide/nickel transport system ATP-binding protein [Jannaschia pohangensis]